MGSKLVRDASGRPLEVVVTTASAPFPLGTRFRVLGNSLECAGPGIGFLGESTRRRAEPHEQPTPQPEARPGGGARRTYPADYPERARELHAGGLSCPKVAAELEVPFTTAKTWIWNG